MLSCPHPRLSAGRRGARHDRPSLDLRSAEPPVPNYSTRCHNLLIDAQEPLEPGLAPPPRAKRSVWEITDGQQDGHPLAVLRGDAGERAGDDGQVPRPVSAAMSTRGAWAAPAGSEGLFLLVEVTKVTCVS